MRTGKDEDIERTRTGKGRKQGKDEERERTRIVRTRIREKIMTGIG